MAPAEKSFSRLPLLMKSSTTTPPLKRIFDESEVDVRPRRSSAMPAEYTQLLSQKMECERRIDFLLLKLRDAMTHALHVVNRANILAQEVSNLESRQFKQEQAIKEQHAQLLEARGVVCGGNCGCDPITDPMYKLTGCPHYVCTSFVEGTLRQMRKTIAITSTTNGLQFACPQCNATVGISVDPSILPIPDSVFDCDDAPYQVPGECAAMVYFVVDSARENKEPLFAELERRIEFIGGDGAAD